MLPKVLIVDDDVDFLNSTVYEFSEWFDFEACDSAKKALTVMNSGVEFDVILADEKMPEMSGVEFLKICAENWPTVTRIMMTGEMNNDQLLKCINEVGLFGFIDKDSANDHFESDFINLLKRGYVQKVKQISFIEAVDEKTTKHCQKIYQQRLGYIKNMALFLGYKSNVIPAFEDALTAMATPKTTTWADIVLFDAIYDSDMFRLFAHELSNRLQRVVDRSDRLCCGRLEEMLSEADLHIIGRLGKIERSLVCAILELTQHGGSQDALTLADAAGILTVSFKFDEDFGASILSVLCNRSAVSVLKNALLFYIVSAAHSRNGAFTFDRASGTGAVTIPLHKTLVDSV